MPAHYFLGNQLLGSGQQVWWSDTQRELFSLLYVCPSCGNAWARMAQEEAQRWAPVQRSCEPCAAKPYRYGCPGSFLHPWLSHISNLPKELLLYEARLRFRLLDAGAPFDLS